MSSVLEHRRTYLRLMRQFTLENGHFTVTDIQKAAGIPRSTAQDWVTRLVQEGCVLVRNEKSGRHPARYAALSAMPSSTCRRIFTTIDGDRVAIYHECISGACAAFCAYHHALAGGVLTHIERDGTLLRESAALGMREIEIGPSPHSAVGVYGVEREDDAIVQHIRSIGGPAYSLSDMMARAEGVVRVSAQSREHLVEGTVRTRALMQVTVGIDDTDSREGGATFALALALLDHLSRVRGVLPISHHVVMLNPDIAGKTAGNSASYLELAIPPERYDHVAGKIQRFVAGESLSPEWGVAIRHGLNVPKELREYGNLVREQIVTRPVAEAVAAKAGISLFGGNGVIGALGAVALTDLPHEILLDPGKNIF